MKTKVLFIDRDGTLIAEPEDEQIDSFEKLLFLPQVISALKRISIETDFELVMVSNQDGLGTDSFPEETFWPVQNHIVKLLEGEGIKFEEIHIDPSLPVDNSPNRKPGLGMLQKYIYGNYDLVNSYVIGDRESDLLLAKNIGCKSIFIGTKNLMADFSSLDWLEIANYLCDKPRVAQTSRKTKETEIEAILNLDGSGQSEISTGLGFFDHMLEQISKHGNMDLKLICKGDLAVDEHHTVEDVGILLGQCFKEALGQRKGIERYAFVLPMDECETQLSIDLGGRSYLVWEAEFKREKVGDLATEMFSHFFKSFCDAAACTLHIKTYGSNEHHKIESIFKAFAKCLAQATKRTKSGKIPSTKGII